MGGVTEFRQQIEERTISAGSIDSKEAAMLCPRCKIEMYRDDDLVNLIMVHACVICGRRIYNGYPTRRGERAQRKWEADEMKAIKAYTRKTNNKKTRANAA